MIKIWNNANIKLKFWSPNSNEMHKNNFSKMLYIHRNAIIRVFFFNHKYFFHVEDFHLSYFSFVLLIRHDNDIYYFNKCSD